MLPHPMTARKIAELQFQERLRDVAQQRRAAGAEPRARSRPTTGWPARLAAISWITGWRMRVRGATRVLATEPRARGSARSVHSVP